MPRDACIASYGMNHRIGILIPLLTRRFLHLYSFKRIITARAFDLTCFSTTT